MCFQCNTKSFINRNSLQGFYHLKDITPNADTDLQSVHSPVDLSSSEGHDSVVGV